MITKRPPTKLECLNNHNASLPWRLKWSWCNTYDSLGFNKLVRCTFNITQYCVSFPFVILRYLLDVIRMNSEREICRLTSMLAAVGASGIWAIFVAILYANDWFVGNHMRIIITFNFSFVKHKCGYCKRC